MFYEVTVTHENDKGRNVQQRYIVSGCNTFTEAEAKAFGMFNGECDVTAIRRSPIREFANEGANDMAIFIATIADIFTRDDGTEKEMLYKVAIWAEDMQHAQHTASEYMQQGLEDMKLKGINQTKFIDVI